MKKKIEIELNLDFDGTQEEYEDLKKILDHHIEQLIDLDSFPEITSINNVRSKEILNDTKISNTSSYGESKVYSYQT